MQKRVKAMPKGSPELTAARKEEIINACEELYKTMSFKDITIKEIGEVTSFTRTSIYNYYRTKEEIMLALFCREYDIWCGKLEGISEGCADISREEIASAIAHSLEDREILLRIQCMNLFDIEDNSRVEHLAEFKLRFKRMYELLTVILKSYQPEVTDDECDSFCCCFSSFLFGIYPFVFHTENQIKAMEIADVRVPELTVYKMVYDCLIKLLP